MDEPIRGELRDGRLWLEVTHRPVDGNGEETLKLEGKRMSPLPPRPDLEAVRFGKPIDLLAHGLAGWRIAEPGKKNGWRLDDGVLHNQTPKTDFGAYGNGAGLSVALEQSGKDFSP